jgi:hypothetical protein
MESGTQFFQRELIMFVRSVQYSDYLEQNLCIQDEFTIGYPLPAKHFTLFSRDQNVSKEGLVTFLFTRYNYVKV